MLVIVDRRRGDELPPGVVGCRLRALLTSCSVPVWISVESVTVQPALTQPPPIPIQVGGRLGLVRSCAAWPSARVHSTGDRVEQLAALLERALVIAEPVVALIGVGAQRAVPTDRRAPWDCSVSLAEAAVAPPADSAERDGQGCAHGRHPATGARAVYVHDSVSFLAACGPQPPVCHWTPARSQELPGIRSLHSPDSGPGSVGPGREAPTVLAALVAAAAYRAYSTARDSRITVTLIWPGYSSSFSISRAIS